MSDWIVYVRERLRLRDVGEKTGTSIVEEVAAQLEDCYLEARAHGATEKEAVDRAQAQVRDWGALAASIQRETGRSVPVRVERGVEAAETSLRGRRGGWVAAANLIRELRLSLRRLSRSPAFSFVVVATLAVGIGANTAIFSVVNGILLKPLPFEEPGRLVSVLASAPGMGQDLIPQSPAVNFTYEDDSRVVEDIGIWGYRQVTIQEADGPMLLRAVSLTAGTLRALRITPALGRLFSNEDDTPGAPRTVMLSHAYWQSRYGADPDIVGQTLTLRGAPHEVIGVLPGSLRLFRNEPSLFFPFRFDRSRLYVGNFQYSSVARLKAGVTIEEAVRDFTRLLPVAVERFPGGMTLEKLEEARGAPVVRPLRDDIVGDVGDVLWVLLGGVGIVLVIACATVANLFLVRAEARERELAVRFAIGAGRLQIVGQFLAESALLGIAGGVLGLGLAYGGLRLLVAMAPSHLPRLEEITIDSTVLLFTVIIALASSVLFGLFPVARYRRMNHLEALKESGRDAGVGGGRKWVRSGLVVTQMAFAIILLVGSGLMIKSFQSLRNVNPGFQSPEQVLLFRLTFSSTEVEDVEEVAAAHEHMVHRLEDVPGVTSVGLTSGVTMNGGGFDPVYVEERPTPEGQMPPIRRFKWIGPGYFETMQNPVIAGRSLTWDDIHDRSRVLLVTENFAREYWGSPEEAIGKRIGTGLGPGDWREIIGVVGDVRDDGIAQDPPSVVYWPMVLEGFWTEVTGQELTVHRSLTYVVRSDRVGTDGFVSDLREAVWSSYRSLPLAGVQTMESIVERSMAPVSFALVMRAVAAAVALLLGAMGVYGVSSYVVSRRARESGLRMGLGAGAGGVMRMVLRQGLILAAIGATLGLVGAVGLARLMEGIIFGVNPVDPLTYASVTVVLMGIALVASYLPARRAARVDPLEAIRTE